MTDLAPHLADFLQRYLPGTRRFSHHTVQSYTECFRLLALYAAIRFDIRPSELKIEHLAPCVVTDFLDQLERDRQNCAATCNIRLAAIKSFFRYLEYRLPACLELALQVSAIPQRRASQPLIDWLESAEIQAILDAPDTRALAGMRDRAMLHLCYAAALRVSELTALTIDSLQGTRLETVRILGKGRRERELPLWKETRVAVGAWLQVRPSVNNRWLFLNARGSAMSTDGFAYILSRHVETATRSMPSLKNKRITPHVIRHSTAMTVLRATGDIRKVSLWLGHANVKTTESYLRASPVEKLEILKANAPPSLRPGTFHGVQDHLMQILSG